ncbi:MULTISPECIES: hypothetical protein [unclassified Synechocystis]|uniref:hypothetical protein n=1 Tax=unclassified Synechocystis TaxID=2640012 RepID=UPI000405D436|nr:MULTISPECIES: hypothetical protein [unclassified Synechocystis]AIE75787.1 hypothetical protein D082_32590 [Synechocystis sp. PCC 6714]MCT0255278.1 hypothetical protein [Synechocystis sp. CS-94]
MKISSQPLRPSPYTAYRDPDTGQWHVARQNQVENNGDSPHQTTPKKKDGWDISGELSLNPSIGGGQGEFSDRFLSHQAQEK